MIHLNLSNSRKNVQHSEVFLLMMLKCVLDWTRLDEFWLLTDRMNIEALKNRVRNRDNELNFNIKQHIYTKSESICI